MRRIPRIAVILAGIACASGLTFTFGRAVASAREAARRAQCVCNLKQVGLALHNYHEAYGSLPPAFVAGPDGRPWHSWRVLILPYIEQRGLYETYRFDEPWDGPNNRALLALAPNPFACPSRPEASREFTSYVAVTGPGTAFPGASPARFADLTDGLAATLMLAETTRTDIPWTAPLDLETGSMSLRVNAPRKPGLSSPHPGGANVAFADDSIILLVETVRPADLKALTTGAGGEPIDPHRLSGR